MLTFGDGSAEARVAARYADFDPAEMHRAQVSRNAQLRGEVFATVTPLRRASYAAIKFLMDLSAERTPHVDPEVIAAWASEVDKSEVSAKIDWLKTLPKVINSGTGAKAHNVPAGRYAVTGERGQTVFVKIDVPQTGPFKGKAFLRIQAGDELIRVSPATRDALIAKVAADGIETASRRYGRELGSCGVCGRTLTDEVSRAEGIGPVCRGNMGW